MAIVAAAAIDAAALDAAELDAVAPVAVGDGSRAQFGADAIDAATLAMVARRACANRVPAGGFCSK